MKPKLKILLTLAAVACSAVLGLWYWQANHADRLRNVNVPQWVAGGGNVSYSIAIHKSQIKPYGTVWKMTVGDGWVSNFPIYNAKDFKRYLARHR